MSKPGHHSRLVIKCKRTEVKYKVSKGQKDIPILSIIVVISNKTHMLPGAKSSSKKHNVPNRELPIRSSSPIISFLPPVSPEI